MASISVVSSLLSAPQDTMMTLMSTPSTSLRRSMIHGRAMRTARCAPVKFSRCAGRQAMRVSASAAKIKVIGCGGGGGNAVNRMISSGLQVRAMRLTMRGARARDVDGLRRLGLARTGGVVDDDDDDEKAKEPRAFDF